MRLLVAEGAQQRHTPDWAEGWELQGGGQAIRPLLRGVIFAQIFAGIPGEFLKIKSVLVFSCFQAAVYNL
jgi:hypothetical protein